METEIVRWLADRERGNTSECETRAVPSAHKCRPSAEKFVARLRAAFAALLEKEIFENE
jgi:hypothetical protein